MNHPADAQAFLNHFEEGGYRPNRYRVTLQGNLPGTESQLNSIGLNNSLESFSFLCVASQLPSSTMGMAEVPYFGRSIKVAGDKTFDDWTCEVIFEPKIRNFFEVWHDKILGFETNLASKDYRKPLTYYMDATVDLLTREDGIIATYNMKQIFPTNIGEVALSYETNNTVARFPVTFAINYFTREDKNVQFNKINQGSFGIRSPFR